MDSSSASATVRVRSPIAVEQPAHPAALPLISDSDVPVFVSCVQELFAAMDDSERWPGLLNRMRDLVHDGDGTSASIRGISSSSVDTHQYQQWTSARARDPLLDLLSFCVAKAMAVSSRLDALETSYTACIEALDRIDRGVIIAKADSTVVLNNRTADEILRQHDGLEIVKDRLEAWRADESRVLRALIREAAACNARGEKCEALLSVSRPSFYRALSVVVASLKNGRSNKPAGVATIFVCDPERKTQVDKTMLSHLYGLTGAESTVAFRLMEGDCVERIADSLCISPETVRTHVKRILLKTGTTRQAQLITVLLHSLM